MEGDISDFTIGTGEDAIQFLVDSNEPFEYSNGETGPARTVTLQVAGGKGGKASDALYGVGLYKLVLAGGSWPNPHRFPGNTALTVHGVHGRPKGKKKPGPQLMRGSYELITADYAVSNWDTDGLEGGNTGLTGELQVPWSRLSRRGTQEDHTIKKDKIVVAGTEINPAQNIVQQITVQEYIYERGMLPNFRIFNDILQSLEGRINDDEFMYFPTGTLLMGSSDAEIMQDASGEKRLRFTMTLRHREYPWNWIPNPDNPSEWLDAVTSEDGTHLYRSASFLPLVTYGVVA